MAAIYDRKTNTWIADIERDYQDFDAIFESLDQVEDQCSIDRVNPPGRDYQSEADDFESSYWELLFSPDEVNEEEEEEKVNDPYPYLYNYSEPDSEKELRKEPKLGFKNDSKLGSNQKLKEMLELGAKYLLSSKPGFYGINTRSGKCHRCDGKGYLPQFHYYMDGVCFSCWGTGHF